MAELKTALDSPVQKTARMAVVDFKIGGKTIKSGDLLMLCYGSANRDPSSLRTPTAWI
jgi:cytochrome P450